MYPPGYWTLLLVYTCVIAVLLVGGTLLLQWIM
jgi:hypothetical protein